jgi:hypothetical protein
MTDLEEAAGPDVEFVCVFVVTSRNREVTRWSITFRRSDSHRCRLTFAPLAASDSGVDVKRKVPNTPP